MLTGRIPFKGETISDTLANILQTDPEWHSVPATTPANILVLLRRCLDKEPRRRLRDIGDIAITLEETTTELQHPTLRTETTEFGRTKLTAGSRRALPWLITGAVVSLLVLFAFIIGLKFGQPTKEQAVGPVSQPIVRPISAVVVLPFDNLSGDPEQEYFVDGMTDALSAELSKISALTVKGQHSAAQYKGTHKQIPEVAGELGVDAVITGSVFKAVDSVRITAQLIHGSTEESLWAQSYEDDLADVLTLQREVALAIAKQIRVKLTSQEEKRLTSARPINPQAHDAYLKGRFFLNKRSEEGLKTATSFFEQAKNLDPDYALAYVGLADCHLLQGMWGFAPSQEVFRKAKAEAEQALEIDNTLGEAHTSLAYAIACYDWDWSEAEREFLRAIERSPNYATAHHWYAVFLGWMGRFDEALAASERAQELDPLSLIIRSEVGQSLSLAGKHNESIKQLHEVLQMDPDFLPALCYLANTNLRRSMHQENPALLERVAAIRRRDASSVAWLAFIHASAGNTGEAQTLLQELLDRSEKGEHVPAVALSQLYASLGDKDRAFELLDEIIERDRWPLCTLKTDPKWDPLRDDPHFRDLVRRMNFPEAPAVESAAKSTEAAQAPMEKIAVPAKKKLHPEPLPSQTSLLMSRGNSIALSPDGKYIVYVGVDAIGTQRLYLRDMENDLEATPIRGTEGATCPFFRPDGQWIGFFAEDRSTAQHELKKVSIQGAAPEFICNVPPLPCGGCWSIEDDSIIFSPMYHESLIKVPATGGAGQRITELDPNSGEYGHLWPAVLPGGKGMLYTVWGGESFTDYKTVVKWKNKNQPQELLSNSSFARYVPTGHLVFVRQGSLMVVPFDVDNPPSGMIREDARILQTGIGQTVYGSAQFTIAGEDGTLAYTGGATPLGLAEGELVWVNPKDGNAVPIPNSKRFYDEWARPRLSPDQGWIALHVASETHLSLYKLGTGWFGPLTSMKGCQGGPVWEPGGNHIAFYHQSANSPPDVYWQPKDSSDAYELLYKTENSEQGTSFSPDGKYLAMTLHHVDDASRALTSDISMFNVQTREKEECIETPEYNEWGADFSPDGKWIVYVSNETGNNEVWIREFQGIKRERISTAGGSEAMWGPDRSKLVLYYRGSRQLWEVEVEIEPQFKVVRREPLFDDVYIRTKFPGHRNYDISKDGQRFLMIKQIDEQPAQVTRLNVVVNWFEELKHRVPTEKK